MKTLTKKKLNIGLWAHHAMALVGGFFGVYSILVRGSLGLAETANLIYLLVAGLDGNLSDFLVRLGVLTLYAGSIVFATLSGHWCKRIDRRWIAIGLDILACIALALLPVKMDPILALYPMFFASAFQWVAFSQAGEFASSPIFSTNNLRQTVAGLTEYCVSRDRSQLNRFLVFGGTLLCFHLGVAWGWLALQWWGVQSILACLPLIALGAVLTGLDGRK